MGPLATYVLRSRKLAMPEIVYVRADHDPKEVFESTIERFGLQPEECVSFYLAGTQRFVRGPGGRELIHKVRGLPEISPQAHQFMGWHLPIKEACFPISAENVEITEDGNQILEELMAAGLIEKTEDGDASTSPCYRQTEAAATYPILRYSDAVYLVPSYTCQREGQDSPSPDM